MTMDAGFWHQRWEANEIGFHQSAGNALLAAHLDVLSLPEGSRIFMPLCGKSGDIGWLLARGHCIVGVELSKLAVDQLFGELGVEPQVTEAGGLLRYAAPRIDIFVGDIFDLTADLIGAVDAVYDRAALVALPAGMRGSYAAHVAAITGSAPQLLISFDYDQTLLDGPPFSVKAAELAQIYGPHYTLSLVASVPLEGGLKQVCAADETVWLLTARG